MSGVSLPLGAYDLTLDADLVKAITQLPPGWQAVLRECHWVAINCSHKLSVSQSANVDANS